MTGDFGSPLCYLAESPKKFSKNLDSSLDASQADVTITYVTQTIQQSGVKKMNRTKKDSQGRVWSYCDAEGSWSHGDHIIGCGRNNGSKWQVWGGPNKGFYEYKTLADAMQACK